MEFVAEVIPMLWRYIANRKGCAINVSTVDDVTTISIIDNKKVKRFKSADSDVLITNIRHYLQAI